MTYPEKGAGYRHMPKFMDRALAAERRADGGDVTSNNDPIEPMPSTAEKLEHGGTYLQRMRDDENNDPIEPMPSTAEKLEHGGTYLQRMRDDEGGRGLSDWRGSFGDNEKPSRVRADNHKRGGRVRKRADGGKVFASPEDSAMMREDVPLTQDRANQIYDAYERVGGGKDVSDNQFVKNSQFGAGPLSGLADGLGINRSSPSPAIQNVGSSDDMDDDAPPNIPKPMRRLTPR